MLQVGAGEGKRKRGSPPPGLVRGSGAAEGIKNLLDSGVAIPRDALDVLQRVNKRQKQAQNQMAESDAADNKQ